jgi:hypothetical protein
MTPRWSSAGGTGTCHCPPWGFVLCRQITTTDAAGRQVTMRTQDLFY